MLMRLSEPLTPADRSKYVAQELGRFDQVGEELVSRIGREL